MRKAFIQGILLLMVTILLTRCQDGGYTEEPVNDSEEVRAAMNDAALKLKGKWKEVRSGAMPVSGSDALYMIFDGEVAMTFIIQQSNRESSQRTYACKFGYSWRYIGKDLAGSFYLRQGGGPEKKYICTIEDDGKKLMLYAPSDSEFQVDDPTMWFEKVEESDETTSKLNIGAWPQQAQGFQAPLRPQVVFDAPEVVFDGTFTCPSGASFETRHEGCEL